MTVPFFKFPSTPHLAVMDGLEIRGDKVLSEAERADLLRHELVVEEKVDGANLGISFDSSGNILLQNRGALLGRPFPGQWKRLESWLPLKIDRLFDVLADRLLLFGEWCFAQHSIPYARLPDWFQGFDVFDKAEEQFLSTPRRNSLLEKAGIIPVPFLGRGHYSLEQLQNLLGKSRVGAEAAEGLYVRADREGRLIHRAKLVRPQFIQTVGEHWSRRTIEPNRLAEKPSREECSVTSKSSPATNSR